ncbi:MAG: efflux RND transporter periplasmic adaptor subunit [bacterium]|nr:efflux RND transporter periplasmic adaptor subunit [bacterium]
MNIKTIRTIVPVAVIVIIVVGLVAIGFTNHYLKNRGPVEAGGYLEAVEVDVKPLVSGRLLSLNVEEGDRVLSGDLLAIVDGAALDASWEAAEAQRRVAVDAVSAARTGYGQAQRDVARLESLSVDTAVSRATLDQARTRRDLALAELNAAKSTLAAASANVATVEAQRKEIKIFAPRDGTVISKNFEVGEVVSPAAPLVTVAELDELEVDVYVPEAYIGLIDRGDKADIEVDSYPGKKFPGKIKSIAAKAEFTPRNVQSKEERVNLVFKVLVVVPNADGKLKPGIPCDVTFPDARKEDMK